MNSVEGLARRLTRGDVLPDTEIFDTGTGEWGSAVHSPIVRFILDELERDGFILPAEWEVISTVSGVGEPAVEPNADATSSDAFDPLDLKLTVSPDVDEHGSVPEESPPGAEAEDSGAASPRAGDRRWVTPSSEGGLLASEGAEGQEEGEDERHSGGEGVAEYLETRRARRRRRRRWGSVAVVSVVGLLGLWGILRWSNRGVETLGPVPGEMQNVAAPEGLESVADVAVSRLAGRMLAVADSVRTAHGLDRTPPDGWLSGPYLASADSFPDVRPYWETYTAFLADLRSIDGDRIRSHLAEVGSEAPDGREQELEAFLEARYEVARPRREELFDQLELASREALALHDYLVAETTWIRYTPAVGTSQVPRDPVLEIASDSAAILEALGERMDALFGALDRSRGGGAPEMSGLGTDLFRGFGLF